VADLASLAAGVREEIPEEPAAGDLPLIEGVDA